MCRWAYLFKTPGSKESDEAFNKFSKQCQEIGEKLYVVDISTEVGKKIIKKYQIIKTPYDLVVLREGGVHGFTFPRASY